MVPWGISVGTFQTDPRSIVKAFCSILEASVSAGSLRGVGAIGSSGTSAGSSASWGACHTVIVGHRARSGWSEPVSYTHLTLPTNREV